MQSPPPIATDLLLLGAGHAHVEVLRRAALRRFPGTRITVIAREPRTPYTGMLPGLIRGDYAVDAAHVDLAPLAEAAGARLIVAKAQAIDPDGRRVFLPGRPPVGFDLLSVDVGGIPAMPNATGIAVRPIGRLLDRLLRLEAAMRPGARLAVVGGGAGGTELALALASRYRGRAQVILVTRDAGPLATAPVGARRAVRSALVGAGIELVCGVDAGTLAGGRLALSDGSFIEADAALWATGVSAPAFLAEAGLSVDAAGCILVDRTLRSISHATVFAAGDCAGMVDDPRPKAGVWAVRAGPPLARNLALAARGAPLRPWRPQREALAILGLGDGRAIAWRAGIAVAGRWVWHWKDWLDRRWMRRYAVEPDRVRESAAATSTRTIVPRTPPSGRAMVQHAVLLHGRTSSDPFALGRDGALSALAGLAGAQPWTVLALATLPDGPDARRAADLDMLRAGIVSVLLDRGGELVGCHATAAGAVMLSLHATGLVPGSQEA